jgi:hypothetical protein
MGEGIGNPSSGFACDGFAMKQPDVQVSAKRPAKTVASVVRKRWFQCMDGPFTSGFSLPNQKKRVGRHYPDHPQRLAKPDARGQEMLDVLDSDKTSFFLLGAVGSEGLLWIIPIDLHDHRSSDSIPHP